MVFEKRRELLKSIFDQLIETFGTQHWWPADSPFEMIIGAFLTQNTAWKNVERSIAKLRENNLLSLHALHDLDEMTLASLIRSSGYYNQKARRLKKFCGHIFSSWGGDLDRFLGQEMDELRSELLQLHGVGPETADSIVLYAALKPSFVVDTYTYRILSRHNLIPEETSYEEIRSFFMECLEPDTALFQEFHALLVRVGNSCCRRKPLCSSCVLNGLKDGEW